MKLVDLQTLPQDVSSALTEAKEAIVDSLLNTVWERTSGAGAGGQTVYGAKPSQQFVSGFLMPRFDAGATNDETSDIHISTIGLDCQVAAHAHGIARIKVDFAIYVRVLPEWAELSDLALELMPNPLLRQEIEEDIRERLRDRQAKLQAEEDAGRSEKRTWSDRQQEAYRTLLEEHGVKIEPGGKMGDEGEERGEVESDAKPADDAPEQRKLAPRKGRFIFEKEASARDSEMPSKWHRLAIDAPVLEIELADPDSIQRRAGLWATDTRLIIRNTVQAWLESDAGKLSAFRSAAIRPSNIASEENWLAMLTDIRKALPAIDDIAPNIDKVALSVTLRTDLRDSSRQTLRVLLENNGEDVDRKKRDRFDHSIHQVSLRVALPRAAHLPLRLDRVEPSYRFQDFLTYPAIGVNCGTVAERPEGEWQVLATTWLPKYQQPRITPTKVDNCPTGFVDLGSDSFKPDALFAIVDAYQSWIASKEAGFDPAKGTYNHEDAERERLRFRRDLERYKAESGRISLGIELLVQSEAAFRVDPQSSKASPYRAWTLLNMTFADAGKKRGVTSWRLFQIAFILAHVPTIASRMPAYGDAKWFDQEFDEETATLLYFPTGGGKSEAFFGLLIFNLFLDRLRGKLVGVTALLRYPLRLLTLQQAQRLHSVIVRAELRRRAAGLPGDPFLIGFWVGDSNTPNSSSSERLDPIPYRDDPVHAEGDDAQPAAYDDANENFNKVPVCPVCGHETGLRRLKTNTGVETQIVCFSRGCEWNTGTNRSPLPFLIVDDDIYARAPAVLLGVIDKLALIGQSSRTIARIVGMFGLARWRDPSTGRLVMPTAKQLQTGASSEGMGEVAPAYASGTEVFVDPLPSLIIQDEAHLLEESLGTFAGLFETLLEQMMIRNAKLLGGRAARTPFADGAPRMPKIIAATATVSVPEQQFGALYQRRHMHFPYPGTSLYESFYAVPAPPPRVERKGLAGGSPFAPEVEAPWMRTYAAVMTNGKSHTVTTVKVLAAYHLTITEYWQDMQDPSRRPDVLKKIQSSLTPNSPLNQFHSEALAKVAAHSTDLFATLLDLMRISLTYVTNKKGGDQVIDAFGEEVAKVHARYGRQLEHFKTELISGGVDVATIQAIMRSAEGTSRPVEDFQPLDETLRNIVATSAISHGVDVDKFNSMFFAGMPSDIAEFIQASSRIGRTHVGFSLLIPTPHSRGDRYIIETHDIFHRFLERMISPPAITRWAVTAHDRVLASVFQAWLIGCVDQQLFVRLPDADKGKARIFGTVMDVGRLFNSSDYPHASKDFGDFAAAALGVKGRGIDKIGAAPNGDYYEGNIRNRAKLLVDDLRSSNSSMKLPDYWKNGIVAQKPMLSLRDVDEAGRFSPSRGYRAGGKDQNVARALAIVRGRPASELDGEDGGR